MRYGWVWPLLLSFLLAGSSLMAQESAPIGTLAFGQTVSGLFDDPAAAQQDWTFTATGLEIVEVQVLRIGGQLTPTVAVLGSDGTPLIPDETVTDSLSQTLRFYQAFGIGGSYTLRVTAQYITASVDNPDEYSLRLQQLGQRKTDIQTGLSIPTIGLDPATEIPALEQGLPISNEDADKLAPLAVYGASSLVRPEPGPRPQNFTAQGNGFGIDVLQNGSVLSRMIRSISFVNGGIGLVIQPAEGFEHLSPTLVFTDQNITRLENTQTTIKLTLANGQAIESDFYRFQSVQAVQGLVVIITREGQRLILSGQTFNLRRNGSGNGQQACTQLDSNRALNCLVIDQSQSILTDFNGWHTLAYLPTGSPAPLSILAGQDFRFFSDEINLSILQRGAIIPTYAPEEAPSETPTEASFAVDPTLPIAGVGTSGAISPTAGRTIFDVKLRHDRQTTLFHLDNFMMGDVTISDGLLRVQPLDGRTVEELLINVTEFLLETGAVRFNRADGSFRTSYPDYTDIETPASGSATTGTGYTPLGFDNLGTGHLLTSPPLNTQQENWPVNPVNGNFYYPVTDTNIPSHTLSLEFTRYYNSLRGNLSPDYLQGNTLIGTLGSGWRHSWQIELDIHNAPVGQVQLIFPNGSSHLFNQSNSITGRFLSQTAPTWMLERRDGLTGYWVATRTDGLRYQFDRVGRLERISNALGLQIHFSPLPLEKQTEQETTGFLVIDPYGRRLELYGNFQGHLTRLRRADGLDIGYRYDEERQLLVRVDYGNETPSAEYTYIAQQLSQLNDLLSPYHQQMSIIYDSVGRVQSYSENPTGSAPRQWTYEYGLSGDCLLGGYRNPKITREKTTVNGQERIREWMYDEDKRICRVNTPREGWFLGFEYSQERPYELDSYRALQGYRIRFDLNPQGLLTGLTDQSLQRDNDTTTFTYTLLPDGHQQRLTQINYTNRDYERFEYDSLGQLSIRATRISAEEEAERIWRYEYDSWGRLATLYQPAPDGSEVATRYSYDSFGYPIELSQGNEAEQRVTRYQHDLMGRLVSFRDGRGNQTTLTWSTERGLLTSLETPTNLDSSLRYRLAYAYDPRGQLVSVEDGDAMTYYLYNGLNQLVEVIDPEVRSTRYEYDEADNILSITLPDGQSVYRYYYDRLNQLTKEVSPSGLETSYSSDIIYNLDGINPTGTWRQSVIDPAQRRLEYTYNAGNRLQQVTMRDGAGLVFGYNITQTSVGSTLSTEYDTNGLAGRNTSVSYNLLGLPVESSINGLATRYTYNAAGLLASISQAMNANESRLTRYTYNLFGEVTQVTIEGQDRNGNPIGMPTVYQYEYDENGNQVSMTDGLGNQTIYTYNELNRLESVTDPLGRSILYNYDERGNLVSVTDPQNNTRTASYDLLDHLTSITNSINNTVTYSYDALGRLQQREERALSTQYTYDPDNNVVAITQRGNENILYSYDVLGRVTSITDFLGHTTTYDYDRLQRLRSIIDPVGNSIEYRWNSNGRLRNFRDELRHGYDYTLDSQGRLQSILTRADENSGIQTRLSYDDLGYVVELRFGTGASIQTDDATIHRYAYTPQGWISSYTNPQGQTWQLEYDPNGNLTQAVDPAGLRTQYTYDAAGQITQIQRGTASEQYNYNRNGNVIRYTATDGLVTEYEYYANDLLSRQTIGANTDHPRQFIYTYDNLGYLQSVTDPLGNVTDYSYDVFGRLQSIRRNLDDDQDPATPALPIIQSFTYDVVGNLTSITYPQGNINREDVTRVGDDYAISLTYNALDQRVRYVDPEDNVWAYSYNPDGTLSEISDPLGSELSYGYDPLGRVNQVVYPNGARVNIAYDRVGNLASVNAATTETRDFNQVEPPSQANEVTTYQMNNLGQLVAIEDINGDETTFSYDVLGQLTQIRYPNDQTVAYTYDQQGRLANIASPEGDEKREYDNGGRLISLTIGSDRYTFAYNPFGDLITATTPTATINYEYDAIGNVLVRDAGEFGVTRYTYDSLYRVVQIDLDGQLVNFAYNRNSQLERITRSNGIETAYTYDTAGRITSVLHQGPTGVLDRFLYSYDSVGNIVRIERQDSWTVLYSYDAAHQMIGERWLDQNNLTRYSINIRYDAAGNRLETLLTEGESRNVSRTLYGYNRENQLQFIIRNYVPPAEDATQAEATTPEDQRRINYRYDANGNLIRVEYPQTASEGLTFAYDSLNRLVAASGQNEVSTTINVRLKYDPFNRIIEWRTDTDAYRFVYDQDQLIAIQNIGTNQVERYLQPFDEEVLLAVGQTESQWYLNDALGSLRRAVDSTGTLVGDPTTGWNYNAFGLGITPYPNTDAALPDSLHPTWLSQFYEPSTGLYLMGLRAYDPNTGRFIQRDPIRHDPQGNLYTYAYNRPTHFVDPQGTTPQPARAATAIQLLPAQLLPNVQPSTLLDQIPQPPNVHQLQAQESFRVLEMSNTIRSELNQPLGLLSPTLGNFYIHDVNPIPLAATQRLYQPAQTMTQLYQAETGWGLLTAPQADEAPHPLSQLMQMDEWLLQGQSIPMNWYEGDTTGQYLEWPMVTLDAHSEWLQNNLAIPILLAETPLVAGAEPEIDPTNATPTLLISPAAGPVPVSLPQAPINPVVVEAIQVLRQQQNALFTQTFSP